MARSRCSHNLRSTGLRSLDREPRHLCRPYAAAALRIGQLTVGPAEQLAAARGFTRAKALALVATGMGCMVAALHEWYAADGAVSYAACLDEALDALSELRTD